MMLRWWITQSDDKWYKTSLTQPYHIASSLHHKLRPKYMSSTHTITQSTDLFTMCPSWAATISVTTNQWMITQQLIEQKQWKWLMVKQNLMWCRIRKDRIYLMGDTSHLNLLSQLRKARLAIMKVTANRRKTICVRSHSRKWSDYSSRRANELIMKRSKWMTSSKV